jgi:hemerythrin-like domain-containing protein
MKLDIARQTQVENRMLQQLMEGLRMALGWKNQGPDFSRKLSTVRFIAQSFQRHLEHLMTLEENNGYMDLVVQTAPQLTRNVNVLRQEHERFRTSAGRLMQRLEHVSPTDQATFADISQELDTLLHTVEEHGQKETKVLQEAFERDEGGEG